MEFSETCLTVAALQSDEYLMAHAERHAPELLLALHDRKANRRSQRGSRHERGGLRSRSM